MVKNVIFVIALILIHYNVFPQRIHPSDLELKNNSIKHAGKSLKKSSKNHGTSPEYSWHYDFGGSSYDVITAIITDASGNSYITGYFSGDISYSGNSYNSTGIYDGFVAKFNNSGSLVWFTQLHAKEGKRVYSYDISINHEGYILITGSYAGSVTFGSVDLPNTAVLNLFFAKIDGSNGQVLMAKNHGNDDETLLGLNIDSDADANIYIGGTTNASTDHRSPTIILKYTSDGNLIREQYHDEALFHFDVVGSSIYYAGTYSPSDSDEMIGNLTLTTTYQGYNQMFAAKSDTAGSFVWATVAGQSTPNQGDSWSSDIIVDASENIYICGMYRSNVVFNTDELTGFNKGFIAKCSSSGTLEWGKELANSGKNVALDNTGNIYTSHASNFAGFDASGGIITDTEIDYEPSCFAINENNKLFSGRSSHLSLTQASLNLTEDWTVQFEGNSANAAILDIKDDKDGNIYTFGQVTEISEVKDETIAKGFFLLKQKSNGDKLWLKQLPTPEILNNSIDSYNIGNLLDIDTVNNFLVVVGYLKGDIEIPGEKTISPNANTNIFVLKYDLNGNYVDDLVIDLGNENKEEDLSIQTDNIGNTILCGTFTGNITIGTETLTSSGTWEAFVAKFSSDGAFLWALRAGGPDDVVYTTLIDIDKDNNIYLTGEFCSENNTIDNTAITMSEGDGNTLLSKIDPDGNVQWVKSTAGSSETWGDYYSWPTGIKFAPNGDFYLKGWHGSSTTFGSTTLTNPDFKYSYYIAKFNEAGDVLWAKSITEERNGFDYNNFDIDIDGNVYIGAQAKDTTKFGTDYAFNTTSNADLFICKYAGNGDLEWVKTYSGEENSNNSVKGVIENDGQIFVGINYFGHLMFEGGEVLANGTHGLILGYGVKDDNTTQLEEISKANVQVHPNPSSGKFIITSDKKIRLTVFDLQGKIIWKSKENTKHAEIDLSKHGKGLYILKSKINNTSFNTKLVVH